jgi:hypothetical protein
MIVVNNFRLVLIFLELQFILLIFLTFVVYILEDGRIMGRNM